VVVAGAQVSFRQVLGHGLSCIRSELVCIEPSRAMKNDDFHEWAKCDEQLTTRIESKAAR